MLLKTSSVLLVLALAACSGEDPNTADDNTSTDSDVSGPVVQPDQDEDGIIDAHEGSEDADGDGQPNMNDKDADGDTIRDKVEAGDNDPLTLPVDSDGDGVPDYLDTDSDNNCIPDEDEAGRNGGGAVDTDEDGVRDFADPDNDGDGILDIHEIGVTDCNPADSDGDGRPDYMDNDSDNDGIGDRWEGGTTDFDSAPVDSDGDGTPDYLDEDSDNDGIPDSEEGGGGGPDDEPYDVDGDGIYDFADTDSDGDGITDDVELELGTDPRDADTDGDGIVDGAELAAGTDPLDSSDVIDGLYIELTERTQREEDFIFELRIQRGDLAFLLDTTGSMSGTANAMASQYSDIVEALEDTFEDAAYGFAQYDDYACGAMGSRGTDLPFDLLIDVTTDIDAVQSELASVSIHSGADGPESSIEALYQAASGAGYDMNCNGSYDPLEDVLPYIASSSDPFGGTEGERHDSSLDDVGLRGGFGFREWSLPLVIYATDNLLRDADSTNPTLANTPGGCPRDAGHTDVIAALSDIGGYVIGANVSGYYGGAWSPTEAMLDLAEATYSQADLDEDGELDPLVFELDQSTLGFNEEFTNAVVTATDQLVETIEFSDVSLEVDGDLYGFVVDIDPPGYTDIEPGESLSFAITFRGTVAATTEDQLFVLDLNVVGDGTTLLSQKQIVIVVKGTSYE